MKSIVALIALVAIGICLSTFNRQHETSIVHAQTATLAPNSTDSLQEQIVTKEREGLNSLETGNLDLFAKLTAEEAVMVDAQGPATKTPSHQERRGV